MLPHTLKPYSSSRRKLLFNFVKEQSNLNGKDSAKSSNADTEPSTYKLRESSNIKYFEGENDTGDFSPDCSEYIPSPDRKIPDSRSTSSIDFQDSNINNLSNSIRLPENDCCSTSTLGGDSLVIDNLLNIDNFTQSPSTVSNLSIVLGETDFVASPTVIYKSKSFDSPKKKKKLAHITYNTVAITNQSTHEDLEKTLTPMRSSYLDSDKTITNSELTEKEQECVGSIHDKTECIFQRNNIEIIIKPQPRDTENDSVYNRPENKPNSGNYLGTAELGIEEQNNTLSKDDREELGVEQILISDDTQQNFNEKDSEHTIPNNDPLEVNENNEFVTVCDFQPQTKKLSRKRKSEPTDWADNKNKKLKNSGQAYVGARNKKHHPNKNILPVCVCKKGCGLKFNTEDRLALHTNFYQLGNREYQWQYIIRHVKCSDIKKMTLNRKNHRSQTYKYYLPLNNEEINVCKVFFLNTLSITEQMIYTAICKFNKDESLIDKRGKHQNRPHQMKQETENSVKTHINSFPKVESHYIRKESTREYLSENLNISKMYRLYQSWFPKENYSDIVKMATKRQYERVFNTNYNYSFFKPKKDQCSVCSQYHQAEPVEKTSLEENYKKHLNMKERVREIKKEEKLTLNKDDTIVAIFDLEKVLTVPQSEVSIFHYKRKYPIYNFTVFDAINKLGFCYVWQAQIGKKGCVEIGSCLLQFIKTVHKKGIRKIIFYSDGCYGQNKNRYIFALYLYVAITLKIDIIHRFFVGGHSQNEGDSMHACIERALKNKVLYTPDQVYGIIMNAKVTGNKYVLKEMQLCDILNIKELVEPKRWLQDKTGQKVRWSDVMEVSVSHTEPNSLLFKYDFDQEYIELDYDLTKSRQRRQKQEAKKIDSIELKPAYDRPLPIRKALYDDLMSLCNSKAIPPHYQLFYKNLKYTDAITDVSDDSD